MVVVVPLARTNDCVDGEAIALSSDQAAWTSAFNVLRLAYSHCVDEGAISLSLSPLRLGSSDAGSPPQLRITFT